MNLTESVLTKLKRDLKVNQKEAVKFITDCFDWWHVGRQWFYYMVDKWHYLQAKSIETDFKGE